MARIQRNAITMIRFIYPILKSTQILLRPKLSSISREIAGGAGETPTYKGKPPVE